MQLPTRNSSACKSHLPLIVFRIRQDLLEMMDELQKVLGFEGRYIKLFRMFLDPIPGAPANANPQDTTEISDLITSRVKTEAPAIGPIPGASVNDRLPTVLDVLPDARNPQDTTEISNIITSPVKTEAAASGPDPISKNHWPPESPCQGRCS